MNDLIKPEHVRQKVWRQHQQWMKVISETVKVNRQNNRHKLNTAIGNL